MTFLTVTPSVTAPGADPVMARIKTSASDAEAPQLAKRFTEDLTAVSRADSPTADNAAASVSMAHRGSKSGVLSPVQQFESFVLRSFVESMLPEDNGSFFGTGTAGQIWKSMLAERIGDEMAKDGGIGIADLIGKRGAKAVDGARQDLIRADSLATGAEALKSAPL